MNFWFDEPLIKNKIEKIGEFRCGGWTKAAAGAAGMESIDDDEDGDLEELDDLLGSTGNDDLFFKDIQI